MTVLPCPTEFFLYNKELYQFLLSVQRNCVKNNCRKIVSISLEIDRVDPLVVLEKFAPKDQVNFYWENKSKREAISAIDAIEKLEFAGKNRFIKAEKFIKDCLENLVEFRAPNKHFFSPQFFCSFGFFDENAQIDYPFPEATIFLPRWQIAVKNERCILTANTIIERGVNIVRFLHILWSRIEIIQSLKYYSHNLDVSPSEFSQKSLNNQENFPRIVQAALEAIKSQHFHKIVLADILDVKSVRDFHLCKSLNNLRQLHPNCYIFLIGNGKGQSFIGASPERLISIDNQELVTDALAGSAARGKTAAEDAANANLLLNSEKETHEHSLVIDFITSRLSGLGLLPQVSVLRLRQLSNIQHLWTPIKAIIPANVHPLRIVAQLHPTPAVAGSAPDVASAEIRRYENFERGLYAAPLGWIDFQGNCEFIVGIRSALIDGASARLYAGAGIVAGSDPQKELAEIRLKFQALLKGLV